MKETAQRIFGKNSVKKEIRKFGSSKVAFGKTKLDNNCD